MNKSPPNLSASRKEAFVDEMKRLAEDNNHGYSQKPPSGRWGPDYDCSSIIYQAADNAGYHVGTGRDKVRFTGTMLKDFEKAGFEILPFANVGISDLKIGDILLNLALHAEVYVGEGQTIAATGSENGTYTGKAGDQTGKEIEYHPVATFDKGWDYILRPPDDEEDEKLEHNEKQEGDDEVPMNYGPTPMNQTQGYNPMGQPWGNNTNQMYPQGYNYQQYPQQGGNLGQMNGYAQANANMRPPYMNNGSPQGYPQGQSMQTEDLIFVMGIEGAKNYKGKPNSRMALFDEDKTLMYIVGFDQNGSCNDIHVYEFNECSEDMPQHLSPLMRHGQQYMQMPQMDNYVTRDEFNQLKEMLENDKSSTSTESNGQRTNQSRNSNARSS